MVNILKWRSNSLLILIIALAAFFRLFALSELPSGLHNDEASFLYNAKAIMETGKDEDGNTTPLFLNSFMDPKPALYSYLQISFLAVGNDDVLASRLPAFAFGLVSLVFFYLLFKELTTKNFALVATGMLAFTPWHLVLTRGTQEVIASFAFSLIALYFLIRFLKNAKITSRQLLVFYLSLLLAMYFYHSAKIFLPLISLSAFFLFRTNKNKSIFLGGIILAAFVITLVFGGFARAEKVSLLSDPGTQLILDEQIRTATPVLPEKLIRVFHNKIISYSLLFADQYAKYFSFDFLFSDLGEPARYRTPFHGLLFIIQLPLLLLGLYKTIAQKENKNTTYFFLFWLFAAPIASALTLQETPSMIRAFIMVVPLTYFITTGFLWLWNLRLNNFQPLIRLILGIGFLVSFAYFLNLYVVQASFYRPWARQYAEQELVQQIVKEEEKYNKIFISGAGDIYIYFALNNIIPLKDLQNSRMARRSDEFTSGKYTFIRSGCHITELENVLFIVKQSCGLREDFHIVNESSYKDGAVEYKWVEYRKPNL